MAKMLELITGELRNIKGAEEFAAFLLHYVPGENDPPNGYGGFFRMGTNESVMLTFDLREFAPINRGYFWTAAQKVMGKLNEKEKENNSMIKSFQVLLDMHKQIQHGADPMLLNHQGIVRPCSGRKRGPGWETDLFI